MRPLLCALPVLMLTRALCPGAEPATVVVEFERSYSNVAIEGMKQEAGAILKESGVDLQWRFRDELGPTDSFPNLIVLKLKGTCDMQWPAPRGLDRPVALGYTYVMAGEPMPFSDIECDRVRSSLRNAASGGERNVVLGQALGRVVAHELHHILNRTCNHTRTGWSRKSLSPSELAAVRAGRTD